MSKGTLRAICGTGNGKNALALGKAINALIEQKHVIIIQFLKQKQNGHEWSLMKRLEPELKMFCFEKSEKPFYELSEGEKEEAHLNILNGLNFAKKVMATGECELLILDGILGLFEHQIITVQEFMQFISCQSEVEVMLTGDTLPGELEDCVQSIEKVMQVKVDNREY